MDDLKKKVYLIIEKFTSKGEGISFKRLKEDLEISNDILTKFINELQTESMIYQSKINVFSTFYDAYTEEEEEEEERLHYIAVDEPYIEDQDVYKEYLKENLHSQYDTYDRDYADKKIFKVNEFLKLRLEFGKVNIYLNDQLFNQCKHIILNKTLAELKGIPVESIDEMYSEE